MLEIGIDSSGDKMPLTASQRVTLITGITKELYPKHRSQIVVTLHQFGVQTETEAQIGDDRIIFLKIRRIPLPREVTRMMRGIRKKNAAFDE